MKYPIKYISILILTIILASCNKTENKQDKIILNRLQYIYDLKSLIDEDTWPGFTNKRFDLPLVYYSISNCYITNPTDRFIQEINPKLIFKNKSLKIYKTGLLDSIPFHMATEMSLGDSTSEYNYKSPFINCSSLEITQKIIPDVPSTEMWATMVIHEYFHGFQFKHESFLDLFENTAFGMPADSLKILYKNNEWFKNDVDKENNHLLNAIKSDSETEILKSIESFFEIRDRRRTKTKQNLKIDIKPTEEIFETMEGTARYVEYSLYSKFKDLENNVNLEKSDSLFHSYVYFKNYDIQNDQWLFLSNKTSYYYAIGFNMTRLLNKLNVDFKLRLFNEKEMTLEKILREQI
jgi:hypothetical protein